MSNDNVRRLLGKLRNEIKATQIDAETRASLEALDADIHALLESGETETGLDETLDRARLLEAQFAVEHPTAERIMREVVDALAKVGL